jgi:uncharacterized protein
MKLAVAALFIAMSTILGWSSATAASEPAAYYRDQKVVYHNDGGAPDNSAYFKRMLNSIRNHIEAVGKEHVEIRVVNHSDGILLFQLAHAEKDLANRLDALRSLGVRFLVCANTLKERQIDWRTLYGVEESDIVPSGVAELARLQAMGFAYIHL